MSIFTDNAAAFATTAEQRQGEIHNLVTNELERACKKALALIRLGESGRARYELARSVIKGQAYLDGRCWS